MSGEVFQRLLEDLREAYNTRAQESYEQGLRDALYAVEIGLNNFPEMSPKEWIENVRKSNGL